MKFRVKIENKILARVSCWLERQGPTDKKSTTTEKKKKKKVSFEKVKHAQNSVGPQKPAKYSLFYFFLFARTLSCTQTDRQTERQTK